MLDLINRTTFFQLRTCNEKNIYAHRNGAISDNRERHLSVHRPTSTENEKY